MLGTVIDDEFESRVGAVPGLGLLPVHTVFDAHKQLAQVARTLSDGTSVQGYEIHHGRVERDGGDALFADEGCVHRRRLGNALAWPVRERRVRRAFLSRLAGHANKSFVPDATSSFADRREARIDVIADLIDEHLDVGALMELLDGPPVTRAHVSITLG